MIIRSDCFNTQPRKLRTRAVRGGELWNRPIHYIVCLACSLAILLNISLASISQAQFIIE